MMILTHNAIDPWCRLIRLVLAEKGVVFELQEHQDDLYPVLKGDGGEIPYAPVISEYLEEIYPNPPLIGASPLERAETRRLFYLFGQQFYDYVAAPLIYEKITKSGQKLGQPDSTIISATLRHMRGYMEYLSWLHKNRKWLAGNQLSLADLVAAAMISSLDYMGQIPWKEYDDVKSWYEIIKSRPGFRPLLADVIPGVQPVAHYAKLDF